MNIGKILADEFKIDLKSVENTIRLLDEGNTIPFIARYRKEETLGLEDVVIRDLSQRLDYLRNLEDRKQEIKRHISEQGRLNKELEDEIDGASSLQRLDDIYRPYRPKKRTRATMAREKGLENIAHDLLKARTISSLEAEIKSHINPELKLMDSQDVIEGARDIIAEEISDRADYREAIRKMMEKEAVLVTELIKDAQDEKQVYQMYYKYQEKISKLANHRVLAINRGERDKVLRVKLELDQDRVLEKIQGLMLRDYGQVNDFLQDALRDSYKRLIFPSIEREIRNKLTSQAEDDAIGVFSINLEALLMQAPIREKNVIALDPGFRTGCKLAALDGFGRLLDYSTIFPTEPRKDIETSNRVLRGFIDKYDIEIIAIGNGTASRETEAFVAETIKDFKDLSYIIVNEAGASIYSASDVAREEFPDLDVSIRGAVSIGRRIQDPLAELVKIDPKHIGVGQYQHDLNQKKLDESLEAVVEDAVNRVGVDLNTASPSLLNYVAGLSKKTSQNIVSHREELGGFKSRKELLEVKGLGPKTFTQCAGFLRIPQAENILDNTGVHPESYKIAKKLIGMDYKNRDPKELSQELDVGLPTLKDIIVELEKPGRDPRDQMIKPILRQDILKIDDLKEEMVLKGTVRNVVDFGAFVDIGVTEDGLVHISEMSHRFIKHPSDLVQVGDIVDVKIISIDEKKSRIGLSMKL